MVLWWRLTADARAVRRSTPAENECAVSQFSSAVPGAGTKQKPGRTLLECLRDREDDVLRFLSDTRIPPTSNQAERDLWPAKTQQKISGRLRSEARTRNRYAIRGYLGTPASTAPTSWPPSAVP